MEQEKEIFKFSKSAKLLFRELFRRHQREINDIILELYTEMNLVDRLNAQTDSGERFILLSDYSGVEIMIPKRVKDGKKKESH